MSRQAWSLVSALVLLVAGCGDDAAPNMTSLGAAIPRQTTVWLGPEGLEEDVALRLGNAGVDEVVVRRGRVDLTSGVPVLRLTNEAPLAAVVPVGVELSVEGLPAKLDPSAAESLWRALEGDLGGLTLAELILDLRQLHPAMGAFLSSLAEVSGASVVPVLTVEQLATAEGRDVARAAGTIIVPAYGSLELYREGAAESADPLPVRLAAIADLGVRVRVGVVLMPQSIPQLGVWGDDLDLICGQNVTEISTSSRLDRTFTFLVPMEWSGRSWKAKEQIALRWMDAARVNAALAESSRMVLPELAGWDLISMPPPSGALGLGQEALFAYLGGEGPAPRVELRATRSGRAVSVQMVNTGPFPTAVSAYGNWLEVGVETGQIVVEDRGDFDRVILGSRRGGEWRQASAGGSDAARFVEDYVGSREEMWTGPIRLPSAASVLVVRWSLVLSTGEELTGMTRL